MSITAENKSQPRELIEQGLTVGRCVKMVEIGTCVETINGDTRTLRKVNISFELPNLTKVFKEGDGPKPLMISKEFTVSMGDRANLRKFLEAWRGAPFTEDQAKQFDITVLLGKPCMLSIIHQGSKSKPENKFDAIGAITPPMKGLVIPDQVNPSTELSYDKWDENLYKELPEFLQKKMAATPEYIEMRAKAAGTATAQPVNNVATPGIAEEEAPLF